MDRNLRLQEEILHMILYCLFNACKFRDENKKDYCNIPPVTFGNKY